MNHRGSPGAAPAGTLALFPSETAWARTRVLDAQAIETCDFDLDAFARFRRIRILTYSASVQMLHTVLERFAESHVEYVLGYSRVVSNVASIIALQTAAIEEVHGVLRGLPAPSRDDVLERVRDGRLHVRVVEGRVSHAKIFLLSDGPDGERCVVTGSANFSGSIKTRGVKRRNRPPSESRTGVRGRRLDVRASMPATLTPRILMLPRLVQ